MKRIILSLFLLVAGLAVESQPVGACPASFADVVNNACRVNIVAGTAGGGPADAAANAAASESDATRQKVTSVLRLLDTTQAAGSQLVTAKGDQTNGMWFNCKAGCATSSDTTATGSLAALNNAVSVSMAGNQGAAVEFASGTLAGSTILAEVSTDGGTTWSSAIFIDPVSAAISTSLTNPSASQFGIAWPDGGISTVRVRVSVFGSGSVTANVRSTANRPFTIGFGSDGTNIRPLSQQTNGNLKMDMAQCSGCASTGAAVPATASYTAGNGSGNLKGITVCDNWKPISITAATNIITGVAAKKTYICSIQIGPIGTATNVALVEGTTTTTPCDTGTAGLAGGTTAATGWNFAANGGTNIGTGIGVVAASATAANHVCLLVSAANQISGVISYTQY